MTAYHCIANDGMAYQSGEKFSTKDRDLDPSSSYHCAVKSKGAWWYSSCHKSNLNGEYGVRGDSWEGVTWNRYLSDSDRPAMKSTKMMVKCDT